MSPIELGRTGIRRAGGSLRRRTRPLRRRLGQVGRGAAHRVRRLSLHNSVPVRLRPGLPAGPQRPVTLTELDLSAGITFAAQFGPAPGGPSVLGVILVPVSAAAPASTPRLTSWPATESSPPGPGSTTTTVSVVATSTADLSPGSWQVALRLADGGTTTDVAFGAQLLGSWRRALTPWVTGTTVVTPRWSARHGLLLDVVVARAVLTDAEVDPKGRVRFTFALATDPPEQPWVTIGGRPLKNQQVARTGSQLVVQGLLPTRVRLRGRTRVTDAALELQDAARPATPPTSRATTGSTTGSMTGSAVGSAVVWELSAPVLPVPTSRPTRLRRTAGGTVALSQGGVELVVAAATVEGETLDGETLVVRGRAWGLPPDATLVLVGPRQESAPSHPLSPRPGTTATPEPDDDGLTTFRVPLRGTVPFGTGTAPLLSGIYRLDIRTPGTSRPATVDPWAPRGLYHRTVGSALTLLPRCGVDRELEVRLAVARRQSDRGPENQERLRTAYAARTPPLRDLAYLVSFGGRAANDNTRAIAAELGRRRPDLELRWAVAHPAVATPPGDARVLMGTAEWWDTLATARVVVTNSWLPTGFAKKPGQTILQAWHGTPYKKLGLDRPQPDDHPDRVARTAAHTAQWDLLLAQNPYSADVLTRAYAYEGLTATIGYPRNDELAVRPPGDRAPAVRRRLGLDPEQPVVLYAPTFRETTKTLFAGLDYRRLVRRLGPEVTVLVRGHANNVAHDAAVVGPQLLDVTLYPDVAELFAAADVLVTDYSSSMFDFAITGRPIVYFVPDLGDYLDVQRGAYFDLGAQAPGPLVTRTDDLADAVWAGLRGTSTPEYAARYARWRADYVALEDGGASARAVDALLDLL